MKMSRIEKWFVNRPEKAAGNIDKVLEMLSRTKSEQVKEALELGCGIGTVSAWLAETLRIGVWGTDSDASQVCLARKRYSESQHLHFSVEDATNLTFGEARFDLVISHNVFHHIPNWQTAALEIARVLRPGGYLMWLDLTVPQFARKLLRPLAGKVGLYSIQDIHSTLVQAGLLLRAEERVSLGPWRHYHLLAQKAEQHQPVAEASC